MVPALIAEILERIKQDPDTLNEYRSLVRKNVPFFMRSYFAAYLYMQIDQAIPARGNSQKGQGKKNDRRDSQGGRRDEKAGKTREAQAERTPRDSKAREDGRTRGESRSRDEVREPREGREPREPRESRHSIPEAEAASIFVSAGRNRRAYGRDLLGLILNTTAIAKEDVGEIRVLDNFSFVQVRKTVADELIASLDGKEFRGRALSVSYAKPRKEEGARDSDTGADIDAGSSFGEESLASSDDDRIGEETSMGADGLDSIDSDSGSDTPPSSHDDWETPASGETPEDEGERKDGIS